MPMRLDDGWNQIQFNLSDFTRRAYGTNYIETLRVQVMYQCVRYYRVGGLVLVKATCSQSNDAKLNDNREINSKPITNSRPIPNLW